ncbi:MAG: polysaccharide deacetylase family protein [Desulfuromonadales bacterium]
MDISQLHRLPFPDSARTAYRCFRGFYRSLRAVGNRLCNLIDCPIVILLYHRVADLATDPERIAVSPENFYRQMVFLKERVPILSLTEDWSEVREPSVIITFDDGYADNVLHALPILEEVGVPATFFVSTAHIDTDQLFWWHRLEAMLLRDGPFPDRFALRDPDFGQIWETTSPEQRHSLYAALCMLMRKIDGDRQEAWLDQLEDWAGPGRVPTERHRLMNRTELQQLAASPRATIGAHSVSHAALAALTAARQREEIFSSKAQLEEITGQEIDLFSYPFGRKSEYNRVTLALCKEAGFRRAAANYPGQVHRWTDPLQLPRHLVRNWELKTFARELKGFWTR